MRRFLLALAMLLVARQEGIAATLVGASTGTVVSGKTTTGVTTDDVDLGIGTTTRWNSVVFTFALANPGTATVQLEVNCNGAGWLIVTNSVRPLGAGTPVDGVGIDNPQCRYRGNVTSIGGAGAAVTVSWATGRRATP